MGSCCDKNEFIEENITIPTSDIIAPFSIIQSKNEIMVSSMIVTAGVYTINNTVIYVYHLPNQNPQPNKYLVSPNFIEVLSECYQIDLDMIFKQVNYIKNNLTQYTNQ
jgi:hypothetical protein